MFQKFSKILLPTCHQAPYISLRWLNIPECFHFKVLSVTYRLPRYKTSAHVSSRTLHHQAAPLHPITHLHVAVSFPSFSKYMYSYIV